MKGCLGKVWGITSTIVIVFLGLAFLVNMVGDVEVEETPNLAVLAPTVGAEVILPTPTATPTKSPTPTPITERTRLIEAMAILDEMSGSLSALGDQMDKLSNNGSLLYDPAWQATTARHVRALRDADARARAYNPPDILAEAWVDVRRASEYFDMSMDDLVHGLDNLDIASLERAITYMQMGAQAFRDARLKLPQ